MSTLPLSDFAAGLRLESRLVNLRADLERAGEELTTGRVADYSGFSGPALQRAFAFEADDKLLAQSETDLGRALNRASAAQAALGSIDAALGTSGTDLLAALGRGDPVSANTYLEEISQAYDATVASLNTRYAGRAQFAGAAEDGYALADSSVMLNDIRTILAAAPDAATARADIDTYFGAAGGFETSIYLGSSQDAAPVRIPDGTGQDYLVRADSQEMRDTLKALVSLAAIQGGGFGGSAAEEEAFTEAAALDLQEAGTDITALRARIGVAEEALSIGVDEVQAERNALARATNDLVGVDPFVAATRFNDLQGQLESLYTVTARLSGLSLTNFLR